jgi:hypothetical protein
MIGEGNPPVDCSHVVRSLLRIFRDKLSQCIDHARCVLEQVKFGEVASAPPTITAKPFRADRMTKSSDGLLLNKIVKRNDELVPRQHESNLLQQQQQKLDAASHPARQAMLEAERERVIALYR